jgi:hypothetical protein
MPTPLPSVVLHHQTRQGSHFDWLIALPDQIHRRHEPAHHGLWSGRLECGAAQWRTMGTWLLDLLPPHRFHYLDYQGPVPGDRGEVRQNDIGQVLPLLWCPGRMVLQVGFRQFTGVVDLSPLTPTRWRAAVADSPGGSLGAPGSPGSPGSPWSAPPS